MTQQSTATARIRRRNKAIGRVDPLHTNRFKMLRAIYEPTSLEYRHYVQAQRNSSTLCCDPRGGRARYQQAKRLMKAR